VLPRRPKPDGNHHHLDIPNRMVAEVELTEPTGYHLDLTGGPLSSVDSDADRFDSACHSPLGDQMIGLCNGLHALRLWRHDVKPSFFDSFLSFLVGGKSSTSAPRLAASLRASRGSAPVMHCRLECRHSYVAWSGS
jgi:hypothetical protein